MELWALKLLCILLIFVAIFIPAILPLKVSEWFLSRGEQGVLMLSVIACFGAGVFFGAYMMHLAPDVEYLLQTYWLQPQGINYPVPELLVGAGFFLLVFIEQAMHLLNDLVDQKDEQTTSSTRRLSNQLDSDVMGVENSVALEHFHQQGQQEKEIKVELGHSATVGSQLSTSDSQTELVTSEKKMGAMKAVVMFVALSSDCIFEGLSLGLQSTEAGVWNLVIAILSHEVVISFMLGLELLKHYSPKQVFWLGFFYAMTNPIGISTGTAIHAMMDDDDIFEVVSGCLQALCGGVFIYVTFMEILAREYVGKSNSIKTAAMAAGFGMMALLKLVPHDTIADFDGPSNATQAIENLNLLT